MRNRKINVMFVTHADKKGGAEQSLIHLINYLNTTQYRIFLISPGEASYLPEIRAEYEHIPLCLESVKKRLGFDYAATVWRIRALVRKHRIDIVHANGWRAPWYAAPLKLFARCKLVWHHRDFMQQRMYDQVLPRFMDRVICISQFVAGSIQGDNKTVIYNGIDPKLALTPKSRKFKEDGKLVVGIFGRIVEWKRYHLVIDAVHMLAQSGKLDWKLLIVGDVSVDGSETYYSDLIQRAIDYGLEHHVEFYGYSSKPIELMKACDLTINFSRNEPFGRVIIESMLAQTPVIVADSGGAPEIIRRTQGGIVVKDGDVEALSHAINSFDEGAFDSEEMGNRGYRSVMKEFHMSPIARQVEDTYCALLEQPVASEKPDAVRRAAQ
ncbi:glycosyltransferase [Paenibacillus sp. J5C_2022]|uniref:glycosyltransferase n=1 Tax=Paenibacillus sp. J5C2022 TaxID=2977129 RepID=UPI0021D2CD8F|nr:glycosyltransferase [Paenibacillus sp. J5C2022]MCU6707970.1 glycosyltransferase [Paenibacillus sp. J5C2022]